MQCKFTQARNLEWPAAKILKYCSHVPEKSRLSLSVLKFSKYHQLIAANDKNCLISYSSARWTLLTSWSDLSSFTSSSLDSRWSIRSTRSWSTSWAISTIFTKRSLKVMDIYLKTDLAKILNFNFISSWQFIENKISKCNLLLTAIYTLRNTTNGYRSLQSLQQVLLVQGILEVQRHPRK